MWRQRRTKRNGSGVPRLGRPRFYQTIFGSIERPDKLSQKPFPYKAKDVRRPHAAPRPPNNNNNNNNPYTVPPAADPISVGRQGERPPRVTVRRQPRANRRERRCPVRIGRVLTVIMANVCSDRAGGRRNPRCRLTTRLAVVGRAVRWHKNGKDQFIAPIRGGKS